MNQQERQITINEQKDPVVLVLVIKKEKKCLNKTGIVTLNMIV
jgi:hypothetical protein